MIGNGFGPGGSGKEDVDLRRVMMYTPTSSPKMAMSVAEYMLIEIGRITNQIQNAEDGSGFITRFSSGAVSRACKKSLSSTLREPPVGDQHS
jgi:hypothetical protein